LAHLQSDLREFIGLLNSLKVEYLVVGGHAVAFHGHPRFTGDIDFFIRASGENRIDILTSISGVDFESAWTSRVPADLDGYAVNFIGADELLKNKQASGRPKDLADASKLRAVAKRKGAG